MEVADRFSLWQRMLSHESAPVAVHLAGIAGFRSVGPPQHPRGSEPDSSELFTLSDDLEHQDWGVGCRLLAAAERTMREWGALEGVLWVLDSNVPARAFYEPQGWIADGTVKCGTILGVEVHKAR